MVFIEVSDLLIYIHNNYGPDVWNLVMLTYIKCQIWYHYPYHTSLPITYSVWMRFDFVKSKVLNANLFKVVMTHLMFFAFIFVFFYLTFLLAKLIVNVEWHLLRGLINKFAVHYKSY